jgi:hypothetical protein
MFSSNISTHPRSSQALIAHLTQEISEIPSGILRQEQQLKSLIFQLTTREKVKLKIYRRSRLLESLRQHGFLLNKTPKKFKSPLSMKYSLSNRRKMPCNKKN